MRNPKKLMCVWAKKFLDRAVVKVTFLNQPLLVPASKIRRVINTAVKKEDTIPMISVVAKPLIGPVPYISRMKPVITEVRFESKIAENAFL